MNVMGRFSSLFHPFGGAVDIIVVQQQNGSFKTTPWYVRFGKFQGVLKGAEKLVKIEVNGSQVNFHMNLDNSGEAYFIKDAHSDKENEKNDSPDHFDSFDGRDERVTLGMDRLVRTESDTALFYDFQDEDFLDSSPEPSECGPVEFDNLGDTDHVIESQPSSEVILVSVDGHILTAPVTSEEENGEILNLNTPEDACTINSRENESAGIRRGDIFLSCLELTELAMHSENGDSSKRMENMKDVCLSSPRVICGDENVSGDGNGQLISSSNISPALYVADDSLEKTPLHSDRDISDNIPNQLENLDSKAEEHNQLLAEGHNAESPELLVDPKSQNIPSREDTSVLGLELSICKNLLHAGMGFGAAAEVFDANRVSAEDFRLSASSIIKNENLVVRYRGKYLPWEKAAPVVLGLAVYGCDIPIDVNDSILVEHETSKTREVESKMSLTPARRRWRRLWSIPFRRVKSFEHTNSISSNDDVFVDSECFSPVKSAGESPQKQFVRTNVPTSDQIASLNLKEGQNIVTFIFSTRVLGMQKVDAHIYLWKYNARIVISDVDGTITRSDVLGQFMPLVGRDWTHSGIARLFSAIKENGYQLLFLSARAIVQAYLTRSFLFNLKQDGKTLPSGPVVISPDGLFPSLYREVIRRAPHEFKIACLEDIKALFPPDYNPFYAGFGNRHTDELSYRKVGIPKGKIFIINPKGEVAINNSVDVKSYTSLHTLVHDMFPPSLVEQEEYNSWNFWKMPLMEVDDL